MKQKSKVSVSAVAVQGAYSIQKGRPLDQQDGFRQPLLSACEGFSSAFEKARIACEFAARFVREDSGLRKLTLVDQRDVIRKSAEKVLTGVVAAESIRNYVGMLRDLKLVAPRKALPATARAARAAIDDLSAAERKLIGRVVKKRGAVTPTAATEEKKADAKKETVPTVTRYGMNDFTAYLDGSLKTEAGRATLRGIFSERGITLNGNGFGVAIAKRVDAVIAPTNAAPFPPLSEAETEIRKAETAVQIAERAKREAKSAKQKKKAASDLRIAKLHKKSAVRMKRGDKKIPATTLRSVREMQS